MAVSDDWNGPLVGLPDLIPVGVGEPPRTSGGRLIVFEALRDFLLRALPPAKSLVGVARGGTNLLPQFGWVMPWGREGSGKTSVLVDLLFHACAGKSWLGYPIERALTIVVVVNEGIPGGLQDKLRQKHEQWPHGDGVLDNLFVYASPWGEFKLTDERMREHAREFALDVQADYVALDPLHTLGTIGAGSPQETETFKNVLRQFGVWNDLGVITAHHSNKSGMVSGDWARHPDTVIHLEKDGKSPATKMTLEKARPADPAELGVPVLLEWVTETIGYTRRELDVHQTVPDEELLARIVEHVTRHPGVGMTDLKKDVKGDQTRIAHVAKSALEAHKLVNDHPQTGRFAFRVPSATHDDTRRRAQDEQTRMDTGIPSYVAPTHDSNRTSEPSEGVVVVGAPLLPGGEHLLLRHTTDDERNDDECHELF